MNVKQGIAVIVAAAAIGGGSMEVVVNNNPVDVVAPGEIVSERTANAKVFDTGKGNGERLARIYVTTIHYEDKGIFRSIDLKIKKKPPLSALFGKYEYEAKTGIYQAHFDKNKPWNYRIEADGKWVEYEALFEESASCSIRVETMNIGVKETITLLDGSAPTEFIWLVESSGLGPNKPSAFDVNGRDVPVLVRLSDTGDTLTYSLNVKDATYPIVLDPSTEIDATNHGSLQQWAATWPGARDLDTVNSLESWLYVGQQYSAPNRKVHRSFASFTIPSNWLTVTTGRLYLNCLTYGNNLTSYIETCTADEYVSGGLQYDDFSHFSGRQVGSAHTGTKLNSSCDMSIWSSLGWNYVDFNTAGKAAILAKSGGTFAVVIMSRRDYDNNDPEGNNQYLRFDYTGATMPYLYVVYTAIVAPTVTTQAVSSIGEITAIGNGNITATGGQNCSKRGVCWNTTGSPTVSDSKSEETDSFGTGAFTRSMTGLLPGTKYYVKAYAYNTAGYGYGSEVNLTTLGGGMTLRYIQQSGKPPKRIEKGKPSRLF